MKNRILDQLARRLKLVELTVLVIDCQATHSSPTLGQLIEFGWAKTRVSEPFDSGRIIPSMQTYLVESNDKSDLPRQFLKMTGLRLEELKEAIPKKIIWQRLIRTTRGIKHDNRGICPAVIHYCRYEQPFLEQLHQEFSPQRKFPWTIICTHEIFRRLFPGLPRKGLRAVAGYLGLALPDLRRCAHHVRATIFIWHNLVRLLEEREGISTFGELLEWLEKTLPHGKHTSHPRVYPMKKKWREGLPDKPGVYRMYRSTGDLLYIGKAKSIKSRVNSYFRQRSRHPEHILEMLSQAQSLKTTVTKTAFEAAIREADEIKLLSPPYNRALRPEERQILYCSKDLRRYKSRPDFIHLIGPLPSKNYMNPLVNITDLLEGKIICFTPEWIGSLLSTFPEYAPERTCFESGFQAFKHEFKDHLKAPNGLSTLMALGMRFWKEKLDEKAAKPDLIDEEDELERESDESGEKGWTQERVVHALKRSIRIGAFQIRRFRWFCRLSESTLAWNSPAESSGRKNLVIFEKGIPLFKTNVVSSERLDTPPGHRKSLLERQKNFDLPTYDRMRVVTTEIRRLIQEGREVELCLHPGIVLGVRQLRKMLKWV